MGLLDIDWMMLMLGWCVIGFWSVCVIVVVSLDIDVVGCVVLFDDVLVIIGCVGYVEGGLVFIDVEFFWCYVVFEKEVVIGMWWFWDFESCNGCYIGGLC